MPSVCAWPVRRRCLSGCELGALLAAASFRSDERRDNEEMAAASFGSEGSDEEMRRGTWRQCGPTHEPWMLCPSSLKACSPAGSTDARLGQQRAEVRAEVKQPR